MLVTKTGGVATLTGNVEGANLSLTGNGTLNLGSSTHTFTGDWTRTSGTLQGNTGTLIIGGNPVGSGGTFTANSSTVKYNRAGAQTVSGLVYNNLTLSGSGAKTTAGVTVNGILSLEGSASVTAQPTY